MSNCGSNCADQRDGRLKTLTVSKDAHNLGLPAECGPGQEPGPVQTNSDLSAATHGNPASAPKGVSKVLPEKPDEGTSKLRTLIVEDEPADVELALRALRVA